MAHSIGHYNGTGSQDVIIRIENVENRVGILEQEKRSADRQTQWQTSPMRASAIAVTTYVTGIAIFAYMDYADKGEISYHPFVYPCLPVVSALLTSLYDRVAQR